MNNLLSYGGLIDAKIRASDIDLPVIESLWDAFHIQIRNPTIFFFLDYLALICGASSQHLSFLHPCKSLAARENQFVANRAEQRILESKRRHGPYPRQYWSRSHYEIVF